MVAVGFFMAGGAYGQNAPGPQFDVASVKRGGDVFATKPDFLPGRIRWTTQLPYLIGYAYHLDFSRVSVPHSGSVYTVEATFDPSVTNDQVRFMRQSLLADRFKMRCHRVTTEREGYGLYVGKSGLRIKEAHPVEQHGSVPGSENYTSTGLTPDSHVFASAPLPGVTEITGRRASMAQLAQVLQRSTGMPVWDRTGLAGNYDFAFRFAGLGADVAADIPSLPTALKESCGLTMKKQKGPVESLVVDSIEGPTPN
jgi:uncharacterized protein (TIGR03435 family)